MPTRNTAFPVHYNCYDEFTHTLTADDPSNHTIAMLRDGSVVTPAGEAAATAQTGVNLITIAADENTGVSHQLIVTTTTPNIVIPEVLWTNELTAAQIAAIEATNAAWADGGRLDLLLDAVVTAVSGTQAINLVPRWTQGVINIVRGDDYGGDSQPKITRDFVDTEKNLAEWTATMTWRKHGSSESAEPTFTENITPAAVAANTYRFAYGPLYAHTSVMLPVPNGYYYDVQLKHPNGQRFTLEIGIINVARDATLG